MSHLQAESANANRPQLVLSEDLEQSEKSASGYVGVREDVRGNTHRFIAYWRDAGKTQHIGTWTSARDAAIGRRDFINGKNATEGGMPKRRKTQAQMASNLGCTMQQLPQKQKVHHATAASGEDLDPCTGDEEVERSSRNASGYVGVQKIGDKKYAAYATAAEISHY